MMFHLWSVLVLVLRGRMRFVIRRAPGRRWAVPVAYTVGVVVWVWRRRAGMRDATLLPGEHVRLNPAPVFASDTGAPASSAGETPTSADATAALAGEPAPAEVEPVAADPVSGEAGDTALEAEASAPSTDAGDAETAAAPEDAGDASESSASAAPEDLTVIEGIGPRINEVLHAAGVLTMAHLADAEPDQLRQILRDANLNLADPQTWPEQARYAAAGDMDGLAAFTSRLRGGRAE
jgi:predicted flap endonuclease-1-like 5' DNA nuclease